MRRPTREEIKSEIAKLFTKDFPPSTDEAVTELIDVLMEQCESGKHLRVIVSNLNRAKGSFPEIADFITQATLTRTTALQPDPDCEVCLGTGYRTTIIGGTFEAMQCLCGRLSTCLVCYGSGQYIGVRGGTSGSTRCGCWAVRPIKATPWNPQVPLGA